MHNNKIAAIFYGDFTKQRGAFNASLNRIKYLIKESKATVDIYLLSSYPTIITSLLLNKKRIKKVNFISIDGLTINILWLPFSIIDYILQSKFHRKPYIELFYRKKLLKQFRNYDLLSVHSTEGGELAYDINQKYMIPYVVTWHGGDIHTTPIVSKSSLISTKKVINAASMNFFVSRKLMDLSEYITITGKKMVLYNGVDKKVFRRYTESEKADVYHRYKIDTRKKRIAFVGNFIDVKNVKCLPDIFSSVKKECPFETSFYFVGGGYYEDYLSEKCRSLALDFHIIKDIQPTQMPDIYNCMDIIVLPSLNEGLPLVCVEALACGTKMVGSKVGGIPEVLGVENTVDLNDNFKIKMSSLIINRLNSMEQQPLPAIFDWSKTAYTENKICCDILKSK